MNMFRIIFLLTVLGLSQALKCWLCTNEAEDQKGCLWDSLNEDEARQQTRMLKRWETCNVCITTRVTGGDVDVVSRGCASECMEEESLGPFAVQSRCCNTDLCNN